MNDNYNEMRLRRTTVSRIGGCEGKCYTGLNKAYASALAFVAYLEMFIFVTVAFRG